ncbi:MAG: transporter [Ruminiclostridium sp.]|nr:transporter [Ruminiclostridium sp.]
MKKLLPYLVLHLIIFIYTLGGICSKTAAGKEFLSFEWIFFYGLLLFILAVYAVLWQQILKKLPLNVAYSNKAVGVIWAMMWGVTIFGEKVSVGGIIGAVLILAGIVLMSAGGGEEKKETDGDE